MHDGAVLELDSDRLGQTLHQESGYSELISKTSMRLGEN